MKSKRQKLIKGKLYKVFIREDINTRFLSFCKRYLYGNQGSYFIFPPTILKLENWSKYNVDIKDYLWAIKSFETPQETNKNNNVFVVYIGTEKVEKSLNEYREHYNHIFYRNGKFGKISIFPNGKTKNDIQEEFYKLYRFEEMT